jgi:hypothetical protein
MRVNSIPSFHQIINIISNETLCLQYLGFNGILLEQRICQCGQIININLNRKTYRCAARNCRKEVSVFINTFFYKTRLQCHQIMHLGHLWLANGIFF